MKHKFLSLCTAGIIFILALALTGCGNPKSGITECLKEDLLSENIQLRGKLGYKHAPIVTDITWDDEGIILHVGSEKEHQLENVSLSIIEPKDLNLEKSPRSRIDLGKIKEDIRSKELLAAAELEFSTMGYRFTVYLAHRGGDKNKWTLGAGNRYEGSAFRGMKLLMKEE